MIINKWYIIFFVFTVQCTFLVQSSASEYKQQLDVFYDALNKKQFTQAETALSNMQKAWDEDASVFDTETLQEKASELGEGTYSGKENPTTFVHSVLAAKKQLINDVRVGKITTPVSRKNTPLPPAPPANKGSTQPPAGSKSGTQSGYNSYAYYKQILTDLNTTAGDAIANSKMSDAASTLKDANNKLAEVLKQALTDEQKKELINLVLVPLQLLAATHYAVDASVIIKLQDELAKVEKKPTSSTPPPPAPPLPPVTQSLPPLKQPTNLAEYESALKELQKRIKDFITQHNLDEAQKQLKQANIFLEQALKMPLDLTSKKVLVDLVLEPASILNGLDAAKFGALYNTLQEKNKKVEDEEKNLKAAAEEKERKDREYQEQERKAAEEKERVRAAQEAQRRADAQARTEQERKRLAAEDDAALSRALRGQSMAGDVVRVAGMAQKLKDELKNSQADRLELAALKKAQEQVVSGLSLDEENEIRQLKKYFNGEPMEASGQALRPETPISVQKELFEKMEKIYRAAKKETVGALKTAEIMKSDLIKVQELARKAIGDLKTELEKLQAVNDLSELKNKLKEISQKIAGRQP